jgi:alpha-galactosidase
MTAQKRNGAPAASGVIVASVAVMALFLWPGPRATGQSPPGMSSTYHAEVDGLALTPPMGWYPWNAFGQEPQNERLIKEIVDALVASGMKDAGYAFVGPDEGICFSRGADGKLTSNLARYPSGLRGLGDYIHGRGLKYALYTDAGTATCSKAMPGTKGHEVEDMRAFAEWRADYIKIDWCNTEGQDIVQTYAGLGRAQRVAGRPVIHSLCSWGEGYPWVWAGAIGHMWRTTTDICGPGEADWGRALRIAVANQALAPFAGPGHWNDPDMLVVGWVGWGPSLHPSRLTPDEQYTHISLWCLLSAPLLIGCDLTRLDPFTLNLLTNDEVLALDQDPLGRPATPKIRRGDIQVWVKELADGSRAVGVFNLGPKATAFPLILAEAGIAGPAVVRDLWRQADRGKIVDRLELTIPSHGVVLIRCSQ